jgi:hypothetical protein
MARTRKTRTAYRDSDTGRFVSHATWRRSRSHEGTRYRREHVRVARPTHARPKPGPPVTPTAPPSIAAPGGGESLAGGAARITGPIPAEFELIEPDEFFESGYESDEEDEY